MTMCLKYFNIMTLQNEMSTLCVRLHEENKQPSQSLLQAISPSWPVNVIVALLDDGRKPENPGTHADREVGVRPGDRTQHLLAVRRQC